MWWLAYPQTEGAASHWLLLLLLLLLRVRNADRKVAYAFCTASGTATVKWSTKCCTEETASLKENCLRLGEEFFVDNFIGIM